MAKHYISDQKDYDQRMRSYLEHKRQKRNNEDSSLPVQEVNPVKSEPIQPVQEEPVQVPFKYPFYTTVLKYLLIGIPVVVILYYLGKKLAVF